MLINNKNTDQTYSIKNGQNTWTDTSKRRMAYKHIKDPMSLSNQIKTIFRYQWYLEEWLN